MEKVKLTHVRPTLTAKQANEQLQELTVIYMCSHVSMVSFLALRNDYKDPIIHNKLKRVLGDLEDIKNRIKRLPIFNEISDDRTEHITGDFYELWHYVIEFSPDDIKAYNGVLKNLVEEGKERRDGTNG